MKKHFCEEDGGRSLQSEGAQKAPELLVSQTKEKEAKEEKQKNKVVGWFSEEMEEKTSKREFQDTEEMEEHQSGRKKFVAKVVEKTMKKRRWRSRKWRKGREPHTKVDVIHWNGELGQRVQQYQPRKWCEDCWARLVSCFREYTSAAKEKHA